MIGTLQVLVSVIFFANKVCVLAEKKRVGWFLGVVAAALAIFYFYMIGLYVFTALEFGLVVLMGYGVVKKNDKNPAVEMWIRLVTIVVMLALGYFAWSGLITMVELGSSLGLLLGTFFLTHHSPKTGWLLYIVGHLLAAYLGYHKEQQFFADFQIASAIVSMIGVMSISPKAPAEQVGLFFLYFCMLILQQNSVLKENRMAGGKMSCQKCGRDISMAGAKLCLVCDPDVDAVMDGLVAKKSPELCGKCFAEHEAAHQAKVEAAEPTESVTCPNCHYAGYDGDICAQCGVSPRIGS